MKNTELWKENKAMGNITENIVKFLIESTNDWDCIPFGVENHIEELRKSLKDNLNETSRRIKSMPDFIAVNKKSQKVMLIDVKYRSFIDRRELNTLLFGFSYGQMKDYLDFWSDIKLVIVHNREPYFYIVDLKDVEWHKHFHSRQHREQDNSLFEQWNFFHINHPIKYLLPNLSDEAIKKAISMIPNKEN
ncbi:MAG TPA: hypothetical protein P5277_02550 [Candidatus Paceibacterota bacterium]|nr:hypothetical protein [Candidatus Paceibacterota bacterium]